MKGTAYCEVCDWEGRAVKLKPGFLEYESIPAHMRVADERRREGKR